jgi:hypothetical protein
VADNVGLDDIVGGLFVGVGVGVGVGVVGVVLSLPPQAVNVVRATTKADIFEISILKFLLNT